MKKFWFVPLLFLAAFADYVVPDQQDLSVETQVSAQTEEVSHEAKKAEAPGLTFMSFATGVIKDRIALKNAPDGDPGRWLGRGEEVSIGGTIKNGILGGTLYWVCFKNTTGELEFGFVDQDYVAVMEGSSELVDYHASPAESWIKPANAHIEATNNSGVVSTDQGDPIVLAQSVDGADAVSIAWLPAPVRSWADLLNAAAETHGVSADLLAIITLCESGGHPSARSHVGATGLMQVMPATAGDIARQRGMGAFDSSRLNEPEVGIDFGAWYLAQQLKAFGQADDPDWNKSVELAAVAYNGGPGTAQKYVRSGALPNETSYYQRWVGGMWRERHDATSPTYEAWLAAGGQVLVDKAEAWLNGQQVSMVR